MQKKKILVVNQSSELYGSDRSLLDVIKALVASGQSPVVVLPDEGPLAEAIRNENVVVYCREIFKLSRSILGAGFFTAPSKLFKAINALNELDKIHHFDCVYTNTVAVLGAPIWSFLKRKKHIWHVREIVETPKIVSQIYKKIVPLLSDYIVFNSENTLRWIAPSANKLNQVVWNGIEISRLQVDNPYKNTVAGLPIVLLVGRINDWKGQDLLLEASLDCFESGNFFNLVFLGSAPSGQEHLVEDLKSKIKHSEYAEYMQIVDFVSDATPYYQHSDIVVVPSKRPEPFGRVAIEGMACAKPIIAARHGGLVEIVEENVTGLLFAPNSKSELTECLLQLTIDLDRRTRLGTSGLDRQVQHFSLQAYQAKMLKIFEQLV